MTIDGSGTAVDGPIQVGTGFNSLFIPSARNYLTTPTQYGRNATSCFLRGYKERVNIVLGAGGVWTWRRIVFAAKGPFLREFWTDNGQVPQYDSLSPQAGEIPARVIGPVDNPIIDGLRGYIYEGTQGSDWYDTMTAKPDRQRITLLSDKVYSFNPGNESGRVKNFNFWYGINKNIMYDDDEQDDAVSSVPYSSPAKPGIGDIYIFDQVRLEAPAATGTASFKFSPEGTIYWHER